MDVSTALLLIAAGLVAGFVNTVAGGGSVVTIPVLIGVLGDASLANGTNRIAILMANVVATIGFGRAGKIDRRRLVPLLAPTLAGAIAGAWIATQVPPGSLRRIFAVVIVLVAMSVVAKPGRWIEGSEFRLTEPWRSLAFFGIGFYGGFIQAGVGFLLLAGLVFGGGFDLVRGNAAKVVLILVYTPVALLVFAGASQVDLTVGAVMGLGNVTGAIVATRLAITRGAAWIRWVLVAAALAAAVRLLFA